VPAVAVVRQNSTHRAQTGRPDVVLDNNNNNNNTVAGHSDG